MRSRKFYCKESPDPFTCAAQLNVRRLRTLTAAASARLHASLFEGVGRRRRGDELDERLGGVRFLCSGNDAAPEPGELLDVRRQPTDVIVPGGGRQFAHLLKADFGLPARDDASRELALLR